MVLSRIFLLLALLAAAGCGESLFDAHGKRDGGTPGGDGGPDGPPVPESCPDECLGDAAADFDKSPTPWRYVEDGPGYVWMDMDRLGSELSGKSDPNNKIRRCRDNMSEPACQDLPDGLLVSSAGNSSAFVPAFEFTAPRAQVLHLIVRASSPGQSTEHKVRLFRNSREDALFTEPRTPGSGLFERRFIVDALRDDRFLLALEPVAGGGNTAVQFFVSTKNEPFPQTCELAASFQAADGSVVPDGCMVRDLTSRLAGGGASPPPITTIGGPFTQHGNHTSISGGTYFQAPDARKLVRAGSPLTVQFWIRLVAAQPSPGENAWAFADFDINNDGGSGIYFFGDTLPQIGVRVGAVESLGVPFSLGPWRFVRMVETATAVAVCIDGSRAITMDAEPTRPETDFSLHLGKHPAQSAGMFQGSIDDVRVFAEALPCDPL